jgi:hypothetical protein
VATLFAHPILTTIWLGMLCLTIVCVVEALCGRGKR